MPSRKTHQTLTQIAAMSVSPLVFYLEWQDILFLEAGILATLIPEMTPDLDVAHRRFGWLGEFVGLRGYAKVIPHRWGMRKRHWSRLKVWNLFLFSHLPFIGTFPRTLVVLLPALLVMMIFSWVPAGLLEMMLWLWVGMSYSDCWHVVADLIVSDWKEMRREFWGKRRKEWTYRKNI